MKIKVKVNKGFSLMEVLVSLSIILIVLSGVVFSIYNMISLNKRAIKVEFANQIVRKLMEQYSSKQIDPISKTTLTALIKPVDIDPKYKDSDKKIFNDSIRVAVFVKDANISLTQGLQLPNSLDKLTWVKIVAYEKRKPDANIVSFNDLTLLSQVTSIIDLK